MQEPDEPDSPVLFAPVPKTTAYAEEKSELMCHIDDCQSFGNNVCTWDNNICRPGKGLGSGGCGKLYCDSHKHTVVTIEREKHRRDVKYYSYGCADCEEKLEADVSANQTCCICIYFILACLAIAVTVGIVLLGS